MADTAVIAAEPRALTPMEVLNNALARGADVSALEKLMDMQERWQAGEARKAFDKAMSAAKGELPIIRKGNEVDFTNKENQRTNYRYEDLATISEAVTPVLTRHGLSFRFRTSSPPGEPISVTCIISHEMGHSEENTLTAPRDDTGKKNALQAIGSTVTYLQRYTLKAALGLAVSKDDDGRGGEPAGGERSPAPPPRQQVLNPETGRMVDPNSSAQLKKSGAWESFIDKVNGFKDARDADGLRLWYTSEDVAAKIAKWSHGYREAAEEEFDKAFDWIVENA